MLNEHLNTESPPEIGALYIVGWLLGSWLSTFGYQPISRGLAMVIYLFCISFPNIVKLCWQLYSSLYYAEQRCSSPSHCRSGWWSQAQAALGRDQIFVKSFVRMHSGQITATQAADKHLIYGSWQMETAIFQHGVQWMCSSSSDRS